MLVKTRFSMVIVFSWITLSVRADVIGLAQLRSYDPTLTGTGVVVAQPEGTLDGPPALPRFEVNPTAVSQPLSLFTYISAAGNVSGAPPPNAAGTESGHADGVAGWFYGNTGFGVAPGVSHVYNYDADYFIDSIIKATVQPAIPAKVVNQSFVDSDDVGTPIQDPALDRKYDDYVSRFGTVFVSAAGNGGPPYSPATAYNVIAVGASDAGATTSLGPTADGRAKPDISAPGSVTSFSTPQVSGAAAILVQAGTRGDGGAGTSAAAVDPRTIKVLLLNGATKPAGWSHTTTVPLDPRYGAGILNVYNSDVQLRGGQQAPTVSTSTSLGGPHVPPAGTIGNVPAPAAWDFNTITSGAATDQINHYFFNLAGGAPYTLTGTLTWNRQLGQTDINNLDLYLYDATSGLLVDQSISGVDNVEHLYTQGVLPGRYDLEVLKHGGAVGSAGNVSDTETYALAYSFAAVPEPAGALVVVVLGLGILKRKRSL